MVCSRNSKCQDISFSLRGSVDWQEHFIDSHLLHFGRLGRAHLLSSLWPLHLQYKDIGSLQRISRALSKFLCVGALVQYHHPSDFTSQLSLFNLFQYGKSIHILLRHSHSSNVAATITIPWPHPKNEFIWASMFKCTSSSIICSCNTFSCLRRLLSFEMKFSFLMARVWSHLSLYAHCLSKAHCKLSLFQDRH